MRTIATLLLGTLLVTGYLVSSVQATLFNFSYEFASGETFSGMLEGELQLDDNTVIIDSVSGLAYSGFATPVWDDIVSSFFDQFVTFDGAGFFIFFGIPADFVADGVPVALFGTTIVTNTAVFIGGVLIAEDEPYDALSWKLVPKAAAAVPEPSSILLFGTGALGLMGWAARRRRTAGR